ERRPHRFLGEFGTKADHSGHLGLTFSPTAIILAPGLPHQGRLPLALGGVTVASKHGLTVRLPCCIRGVAPLGQHSRTCLGIFCVMPEAKGSIALEKGVTLAPLWILHHLGERRSDRRAVLVRVEVLPVCLLV